MTLRGCNLLAASLVNDRPESGGVGNQINSALKPLALFRMPLTPVHGHEKIAPWHSRLDGLAEREVVEALEHLAHLAGLRNNKDFVEDKDWSKTSQDAEKELEQTKLTEEMALHSVKPHAEREVSRIDEAFQPGDKLKIAIRRLRPHGRF
jgi:hypothetical protein